MPPSPGSGLCLQARLTPHDALHSAFAAYLAGSILCRIPLTRAAKLGTNRVIGLRNIGPTGLEHGPIDIDEPGGGGHGCRKVNAAIRSKHFAALGSMVSVCPSGLIEPMKRADLRRASAGESGLARAATARLRRACSTGANVLLVLALLGCVLLMSARPLVPNSGFARWLGPGWDCNKSSEPVCFRYGAPELQRRTEAYPSNGEAVLPSP